MTIIGIHCGSVDAFIVEIVSFCKCFGQLHVWATHVSMSLIDCFSFDNIR